MVSKWTQDLPWIVPWQKDMTLDPFENLVTEPDDDTRRRLTKEWREAKLAELNYVGLTSALVTSAFASAIGWQTIAPLPYVLGIWFAGLILVLASIYIASSQSIALHRLTTSDTGIDKLCKSFGHDPNQTPQNLANSKVQKAHVLVWQVPIMLLNLSITVFLVGFLCQVFDTYLRTRNDVEQLVLTVLGLAFTMLCCLMSIFTMYMTL